MELENANSIGYNVESKQFTSYDFILESVGIV